VGEGRWLFTVTFEPPGDSSWVTPLIGKMWRLKP
jgi:hypothetical protein